MDDIVSIFGREHVNTNIAVEFYITSSSGMKEEKKAENRMKKKMT